MVCVIQLKRGKEVETGTENSEEKSEICESLKDNVVEEESSGGEKVQESSRVEAEKVSNKNSGSVDGSGDNKVDKEDKNKVGDQREEPMETEDTQEDEEVLAKEATQAPEEADEKTGLTPDKIDLAACKTPAKKDDQTSSHGDDAKDGEKKSAPTMTMRFVDETVETSKEDASREESKDEEENMETENSKQGSGGDAFDDMLKGKNADKKEDTSTKDNKEAKDDDEGGDKPSSGLKLASFSTMAEKSGGGAAATSGGGEGGASKTLRDGCAQCKTKIGNVYDAIVWETMQFCNESCLGQYQARMSSCSSCKKEVVAASLGKYCVRFGSDIKQFCSNICLEDYKKGLKVCSYCQKDISGGEGFLAPIGDKGQFKDFCDGGCLKKYEHIYLGKTPDPETLPCNVCKEVKYCKPLSGVATIIDSVHPKVRKVEREVVRSNEEMVKLCGDACFNAFKFVSSVDTQVI